MGYETYVLDTGPIAYFPMSDSVPCAMAEVVHGWNGSYLCGTCNVAFGEPGYPSGPSVGFYADHFARCAKPYTANLAAALAADQGSVLLWFRGGAEFWTSGTQYYLFEIGNRFVGSDMVYLYKPSAGVLRVVHSNGTITRQHDYDVAFVSGFWHSFLVRWSVEQGRIELVMDGKLQGNIGAPGVWSAPIGAGSRFGAGATGANPVVGNLCHAAIWNRMLTDNEVHLTRRNGDMGRVYLSITDFDGEVSGVTIPTSDLTAANIDDEYAAAIALQAAIDGVSLGLVTSRTHVGKVSPQAVGKASSELAQREAKALVRYYDDTTFQRGSLEIPCIDLSLQLSGHPGWFYDVNYDGDEEAAITALVTALNASLLPSGGNTCVVDSIVHVGRNI